MKATLLFLLGFSTFAQNALVTDPPLSQGEELEFKLTYGWFTVGKGKMTISDEKIERKGKECVKINVEGETAGLAGIFSKVDDEWGAIIQKDNFIPHYSYRDISEGKDNFFEEVFYDYEAHQVKVESLEDGSTEKKVSEYELQKALTYDIMGGLMYARSIDYRSLSAGDTISLHAFFEDKFYDFDMIYDGIEKVKTKVGKIKSHRVIPIMEQNKVFMGKDAVTFWVSADANRLPLKVKARMSFGTAYCELTSYKNVKYGIDFN